MEFHANVVMAPGASTTIALAQVDQSVDSAIQWIKSLPTNM